jgi:trimeric autotransporter adhesin
MDFNYNHSALSMTGLVPASQVEEDLNLQVIQNTADIADLEIAVDAINIVIATNTGNIATNTSNIATNTSNIATNTSNIATNTSNIATNTSNIATNTSNIATNTSNIATNTTNISANATAISNINTDIAELTLLEASIDVNTIDILNLQSIGTNWVYNNSYGNPYGLTGYNQLFS